MNKKGTDGRRTSGITPLQVMNELSQHGYQLLTTTTPPTPTTAFRKVVTETRNQMRQYIPKELRHEGHEVVTSKTGDSVFMVHVRDRQRALEGDESARILLPVKGHMTDRALGAIEQKTGVAVKQLQQLQHKRLF